MCLPVIVLATLVDVEHACLGGGVTSSRELYGAPPLSLSHMLPLHGELILVMSLIALNYNCLLTLSLPSGCESVEEGTKIFSVASPALTQCFSDSYFGPILFSPFRG